MRSITPSRYGADDWIRTSMIRFTRPAPFSVEPRRHQAGVQGIEPCWAGLEAACFPEAHSCNFKGHPTGFEPVPPASQAGVPTKYTTDTIGWAAVADGPTVSR